MLYFDVLMKLFCSRKQKDMRMCCTKICKQFDNRAAGTYGIIKSGIEVGIVRSYSTFRFCEKWEIIRMLFTTMPQHGENINAKQKESLINRYEVREKCIIACFPTGNRAERDLQSGQEDEEYMMAHLERQEIGTPPSQPFCQLFDLIHKHLLTALTCSTDSPPYQSLFLGVVQQTVIANSVPVVRGAKSGTLCPHELFFFFKTLTLEESVQRTPSPHRLLTMYKVRGTSFICWDKDVQQSFVCRLIRYLDQAFSGPTASL